MKKSISELRQDMVSGDWVLIATGRAKRPHDFLKEQRAPLRQPKSSCPFEKLHSDVVSVYARTDDEEKVSPRLIRLGRKNWWVQAIPNKFPALSKSGVCSVYHAQGPYQWTDGVGFHEIVITRDHERSIARMDDAEVELLVRSFQDRYLALQDEGCVEYISIFHNHGKQSGATIAHPHSQIIALPVVPPDVGRSLKGSADYYHKHKECIHCRMLSYELQQKSRLVYEKDGFVVLVPYASRVSFEVRIFPKRHSPRFETMTPEERFRFANTLRTALGKLYWGLNNPDYNFFIHTAPTGTAREFDHYHWHLEILPKTAIWGGFDIGTGIEISAIAPERAAAFLRNVTIK